MPNPYIRNSRRLDTYLSQLLWALAKKNGGELRISGYDVDIPARCAIFTEWDNITHELVIKAADISSEMIVINTEQQWATSQRAQPEDQPAPQPRATQTQQPQRSALLNDDDLARIEQGLLKRAAERQDQRAADLTNSALREM